MLVITRNCWKEETMECMICKKTFTPANSRQKTCSTACRKEKQRRLSAEWYRYRHPLEEKTCGCCGKTFLPQRRNQEYCTPECRGLNRKSEVQQSKHRRTEGQQSGEIVEINRMAREQGLTYGKLVAKMYAGQQLHRCSNRRRG